jgi:hypothetical protein
MAPQVREQPVTAAVHTIIVKPSFVFMCKRAFQGTPFVTPEFKAEEEQFNNTVRPGSLLGCGRLACHSNGGDCNMNIWHCLLLTAASKVTTEMPEAHVNDRKKGGFYGSIIR